jgi:hypothetical protein
MNMEHEARNSSLRGKRMARLKGRLARRAEKLMQGKASTCRGTTLLQQAMKAWTVRVAYEVKEQGERRVVILNGMQVRSSARHQLRSRHLTRWADDDDADVLLSRQCRAQGMNEMQSRPWRARLLTFHGRTKKAEKYG